jgi:Flp pilus assembly protein TadD
MRYRLHRAAELSPQDAEAHSNLGTALRDRGQWDEALTSLRRALEIQPRDVEPLVDAAAALRALGRARESVAFYKQALEIGPRSAEAHNNLGNAVTPEFLARVGEARSRAARRRSCGWTRQHCDNR